MSLGSYRLSQRKVKMCEDNCENKPLIDCQQDVVVVDDDNSGSESETPKTDVVNEKVTTSADVNSTDEKLATKDIVDDQLGNKVLNNFH